MEAKKAAIEDYFRGEGNLCKKGVEKVCLDPDLKFMFLDLERQLQLGNSLLTLPPTALISLDDYLDGMFRGEYHVDTSAEIQKALFKVQELRDSLEVKIRVGSQAIESDMAKMCNRITSQIIDYFALLTDRLHMIYQDNYHHTKQRLAKFEAALQKKIEAKATQGSEEFNLNTFYNKFKMLQKEPDKLEKYLQTQLRRKLRYEIFAEEKDIKPFYDLYADSESFESNLINYIDNKTKIREAFSEEDRLVPSRSAEEQFNQRILDLLNEVIGNATHFDKLPGKQPKEESKLKSKADIGTPVAQTKSAKVPQKSQTSSMKGSTSRQERSTSKPKNPTYNDPVISPSKTVTESPVHTVGILDNSVDDTTMGSLELALRSPSEFTAFLSKKEVPLCTSMSIELAGEHYNNRSTEQVVQVLDRVSTLDHLKLVFKDVLHIGEGRFKEVLECVADHGEMQVLEFILDRSKLNKSEIAIVKSLLEATDRVDRIHFSITG